jgi:hypothetical protein
MRKLIKAARDELAHNGIGSDRRVSLRVRVDPGLLDAARRASGIWDELELIEGALVLMAARDDFGPWMLAQAGRLPDDFDLAI